jgi:ribosomal protein S18 acetylase RimI-like enzyme
MTLRPGQEFIVETAKEEDWPWIVQGQLEIALTRQAAEKGQPADRQALEQRVAEHVARLRTDEGFPSQAFVARMADGKPAGFVWVAKTHNDSTGRHEASLLNQYVVEECRGRGLGHTLMATAEEWARSQGLPRISLAVGVHNTHWQKLYESLGYEPETLRMSKNLAGRELDEIRLTNE